MATTTKNRVLILPFWLAGDYSIFSSHSGLGFRWFMVSLPASWTVRALNKSWMNFKKVGKQSKNQVQFQNQIWE